MKIIDKYEFEIIEIKEINYSYYLRINKTDMIHLFETVEKVEIDEESILFYIKGYIEYLLNKGE